MFLAACPVSLWFPTASQVVLIVLFYLSYLTCCSFSLDWLDLKGRTRLPSVLQSAQLQDKRLFGEATEIYRGLCPRLPKGRRTELVSSYYIFTNKPEGIAKQSNDNLMSSKKSQKNTLSDSKFEMPAVIFLGQYYINRWRCYKFLA